MILLAVLLAVAQSATQLTVKPWTGTDLQVTTDSAAKYRLEISGKSNASVHLHAVGVAQGWIAAFCTPKLCSPQRVELQLPSSGNAVVQFELIRESDTAPKRSGATITDGDGASVSVPAVYRG